MGLAASLGADAMHATTANAVITRADLNFMVLPPLGISFPTVFWT
jgi:hypothetical protein